MNIEGMHTKKLLDRDMWNLTRINKNTNAEKLKN